MNPFIKTDFWFQGNTFKPPVEKQQSDIFPWFNEKQTAKLYEDTANVPPKDRLVVQQKMYREILPSLMEFRKQKERVSVSNALYAENLNEKDANKKEAINLTLKIADFADTIRRGAEQSGTPISENDDQKLISEFVKLNPWKENLLSEYINNNIDMGGLHKEFWIEELADNNSLWENIMNSIQENPLISIPVGTYWAIKGTKELIKRIPTEKKAGKVVQYVMNNIVNEWTKVAPEFVDKKTLNVVDYFANMARDKVKKITGNKLWSFRWLYNQVKDDLAEVVTRRKAILEANKWVQFGEEILSKLKTGIDSIKNDVAGEKKHLQKVYDSVKNILDQNGGKISLEDAEQMKETAYEKYDYSKWEKVAVKAKDMATGKGYQMLGKGIKEAIDDAIPDIKVPNMEYGKLKDLSKTVWVEAVKAERMTPYTTLGEYRKRFGEFVSAVPRISALSNVAGDLPEKKIDEKNMAKIITLARRFPNKIKWFIEKYWSKVSDVVEEATSNIDTKTALWVAKDVWKWIMKAGNVVSSFIPIDPFDAIVGDPEDDKYLNLLTDEQKTTYWVARIRMMKPKEAYDFATQSGINKA